MPFRKALSAKSRAFNKIALATVTCLLVVTSSIMPTISASADNTETYVDSSLGSTWVSEAWKFHTKVTSYYTMSGGSHYFTSSPMPAFVKEEWYGGCDNVAADHAQLVLLLAHAASTYNGVQPISFGSYGTAFPEHVRLGYDSPDGCGNNLWTIVINCHFLSNANRPNWGQAFTGMHQLLGFATEGVIVGGDLEDLACRLTGLPNSSGTNLGRFTVWNAYWITFTAKTAHANNIPRAIAEEWSVQNDFLNSYNPYVNVDGFIVYFN